MTNDEVVKGERFSTTVTYLDGNIAPANISVYVNGGLVTSTMQQMDIHRVYVLLTDTQTIGDVAIVVKFETTTNNYSYLCNDPADGLTLTNSEIQPGSTTIGTINSPVNIENNWLLDRVVIDGIDVTDNFELEFDETDDKKATIKVLNGYVISNDVLIWLKPTAPSLDWVYEDGPFKDIVPLPSTVPYDQALEQFYEFALTDKLNIIKDYINYKYSDTTSLNITISHLSFDPTEKVFTFSWNFHILDPNQTFYGAVTNGKFKVVKSTDSSPKYEIKDLPSTMSTDEAYDFLINDKSWSISGYDMEGSELNFFYANSNIAEEVLGKSRFAVVLKVFKEISFSHPIYYLQNITPGP